MPRSLRSAVRFVLCAATAVSMSTLADSAPAAPPAFAPNHVFVGAYDRATQNAAVFEFDEAGVFVRKFDAEDVAAGNEVYALAFGPDGRLYCTTAGGSTIVAVAPDLTRTTIVDAADGLGFVVGVAFGREGRILAATRNNGGSVVEATLDGTVTESYTADSDQSPSYVTVGPNGHVFVTMYSSSDTARNAIVELDADLSYVRTIGAGEYSSYPANVTFQALPGTAAYLVDYGSSDIHVLNATTLATVDKFNVDGIGGAYGSAFGPDGLLYVAGYNTDNVTVIRTSDRTVVRTLAHPDLSSAAGVAFAPFRFAVKSKMSRLSGGFGGTSGTRTEKTGVLSYFPGSGQSMFLPSDGPAVVGVGVDVPSGDGSARFVSTVSLGGGINAESRGALSFTAAGTGGTERMFVPKSIAGQVQSVGLELAEFGAFKTKKRVP